MPRKTSTSSVLGSAQPIVVKGNPSVTILVILLVIQSFFLGSLWSRVRILEKNAGGGNGLTENPAAVPAAPSTLGSAENLQKLQKDDHVRGNRDARIVLFEYSDLECPFCKQFHPVAKQAVDEYKGQVAWVFRHFPLDNLHSKARSEAEAAECANSLGKDDVFWKFVDKIYEITPANNGLDPQELPKIAAGNGINQAAFNNCLASRKFKQIVEDDYQSGLKAGISGTPGNILLDTKTGKTSVIPGAVPYDQLKSAIDALLAQN